MDDKIVISSDSECEAEDYDADNEEAQDSFKLERRTFRTQTKSVDPNLLDDSSVDCKSVLEKMGYIGQTKQIAVIKPLMTCKIYKKSPKPRHFMANIFMLQEVKSSKKMDSGTHIAGTNTLASTSTASSPTSKIPISGTKEPSSSSKYWSQASQQNTAMLDNFFASGVPCLDFTESDDETPAMNNCVSQSPTKADAICMSFNAYKEKNEVLSGEDDLPDLESAPLIISKTEVLCPKFSKAGANCTTDCLPTSNSTIELSVKAKLEHAQPVPSETRLEKPSSSKHPCFSKLGGPSPKKLKLEKTDKKIKPEGESPLLIHKVESKELPTCKVETNSEAECGSPLDEECYFPGFAACPFHKKQEALCTLWYNQYVHIRRWLTKSCKKCESCQTLHLAMGGHLHPLSNANLPHDAHTNNCPEVDTIYRVPDVEVITISDSGDDCEKINVISLESKCTELELESQKSIGFVPNCETKVPKNELVDVKTVIPEGNHIEVKQSPNKIQAPITKFFPLTPSKISNTVSNSALSEVHHTKKLKSKSPKCKTEIQLKSEQVTLTRPKQEERNKHFQATPSTSRINHCQEIASCLDNYDSEEEFEKPECSRPITMHKPMHINCSKRKAPSTEPKLKVKAASLKSVDLQLILKKPELTELQSIKTESADSSDSQTMPGMENSNVQPSPVHVNNMHNNVQYRSRNDDQAKAAIVSQFDSSIEQVYLNCLEQANDRHSLGMHAIFNLCDTTMKPSVAVVEAVFALWQKCDIASIAQQCLQVICCIQRNHRMLGNIKLWNCLCESANILKTSVDLVNMDSNMRIVELVTQVIEEDLQEQRNTCGMTQKDCFPRHSLAYKWLSISTVTAIRNWMCSAIVRNNEPDLEDFFCSYFKCLSRLLLMSLEACQKQEIIFKSITGNFCIMYSKLLLWKQRHLLISQIQPAFLRLQLASQLLDCHASKVNISEKRTRHFFNHELSMDKIVKYYFRMGAMKFDNAIEDKNTTQTNYQSDEEKFEELIFIQLVLLRSYLEMNKRSLMGKVKAVDRLQERYYHDCPGLAENARFQQTLSCLRLLFL